MSIEQSRWVYLNADIRQVADDAPVTGLTNATLVVRYKKSDSTSLSTKSFLSTNTTSTEALSIGDTSVDVSDASIFPIAGTVIINPGEGTEEEVTFSRIPTIDTLTISATANAHASGETIRLKDFIEVGVGIYTFYFSPSETDTLGNFLYIADPTNVLYKNYTRQTEVVTAISSGTISLPVISTCLLYGNLMDLNGTALANESVSVRLLATPLDISNVGVDAYSVSATTDENGYFSIILLQTAIVDISIPVINFRQTITIPSTDTANIFTLSSS